MKRLLIQLNLIIIKIKRSQYAKRRELFGWLRALYYGTPFRKKHAFPLNVDYFRTGTDFRILLNRVNIKQI